jgi:hypothetical protein
MHVAAHAAEAKLTPAYPEEAERLKCPGSVEAIDNPSGGDDGSCRTSRSTRGIEPM